jgi:hypothetical protein
VSGPRPRRRIALVTGATAGIGRAFAAHLAVDHDLVLVARDPDRLLQYGNELKNKHGGDVAFIRADLSTEDGLAAVARRLADPARPIDLLVNNAGKSLNRSFLESTPDDEESLLALNVRAVMRLTHAVLPGMVERRHGGVINVSSVAGFTAVMPGSTYPAGKAWVTNFSESVADLVAPFGVRVMALCPGYTRTEFHGRAGIDTTSMPDWLWLDADRVVAEGLRDLRYGKVVSVPDWRYKGVVFALRHLPRPLLKVFARDARGRLGR